MSKSTVILLALAFMVFAGNAFAWDYECSVRVETESFDDDSVQEYIPSGVYYVSPYQLYCEVDGPDDSGRAYANIHSAIDGEHIIDYDNLLTYGGEGALYHGQGEQIDCTGGAIYVTIYACAEIYDEEECDFAAAYAKFSWGGK